MTLNLERGPVAAKVFYQDIEEGTEIPPLVNKPVNHTQLVKYAGASGDFNPLHTDPEVGVKVGLGGPIAHGMLIMGFLGHLISDYLGGPGALRKFGVRFQSMTRHGDVISCTGNITKNTSKTVSFLLKERLLPKTKGAILKPREILPQ